MHHISKMITVACVAPLLIVSAARSDQKTNEAPDVQVRRAKFGEMFERLQPAHIYGKVVDQDGNPISAADVSISWESASFLVGKPDFGRTDTVRSNADGGWEYTIDKPHRAFAKAQKDGFQYIYTDDSARNLVEHRTTRDDPVIIVLRRKGETTFLLKELTLHLQVLASESGKTIGYDFIQREPIRNVANPSGDDAPHCDFTVEATFNENDATWTAVLSPGNTNGGIIVSEQLLYEAPDTGYQPEYMFTPEDRKPVNAKYVYLKSRDPAIYTRLEIEHINANKDFFRLSGKSVTNPYGDRNLEQATDLPYEVTKRLIDEAKTAFRQNKPPEKPDLPKLVKEAKEKAEKDKPRQ